jgi:hypothetical protein
MSHIRIENDYLRTPEFIKFLRSNEYSIWLFLTAHIVRKVDGRKVPAGAIHMFKKYYMAHLLCASYSMSDIAEIFGWMSKGKPNKSNVSKIIKNLKEMGLIKIITENTPVGQKYIYQLGYYRGTFGQDDYQEFLFFDQYFEKCVEKVKRQKRDEMVRKAKENLRKYGLDVVDPAKARQLREEISKIDLRG